MEETLTSNAIQPPFSQDLAQARADYALVLEDVHLLKEHTKVTGLQELY